MADKILSSYSSKSYKPFRYIICNLILSNHPFCTARFMHPLAALIIYKNYLISRILYLEYKASINYENIFNSSVDLDDIFIISVRNNYFHAVKTLLERGVNIHLQDDYAIRIASVNGCSNMTKLLIEKGANIYIYIMSVHYY